MSESSNNNLSNFFNGIFISNQSLDIITKTGNYCGANISELTPYITPSSWCGIKAYVQSDNAAFFNIITNDNIVINVYRDGDGTYKFYPLALKSDLSKFGNLNVNSAWGTSITSQIDNAAIIIFSALSGLDAMYLYTKTAKNFQKVIGSATLTAGQLQNNSITFTASTGGQWVVICV